MIEWSIIIILSTTLVGTIYLLRNMFETLNNIQTRLGELYFLVKEYEELVKSLNASETYYGDSMIEAFVKMSNQLSESFKGVIEVRDELIGDPDAEKENKT